MKLSKYIAVILSSAIMFSCAPARANDTECDNIAYMAREIMKERQNNYPMQIIIKFRGSIKDKTMQEYHTMLVRSAYKEPLYMTDENKHRKVNEFQNTVFMACLDYEQLKQLKK